MNSVDLEKEEEELSSAVCSHRHHSRRQMSGLADFLSPLYICRELYGRRTILTFDQPPYISSKYSTFDPGQTLCTMMDVQMA